MAKKKSLFVANLQANAAAEAAKTVSYAIKKLKELKTE